MPVGPTTAMCPTSPMCVTNRNGVAPSVRVTMAGGPSRCSFFSGPAHTADSGIMRSEEHTSELQSLMRISYAVFCLKKKIKHTSNTDLCVHKKQTQHPSTQD